MIYRLIRWLLVALIAVLIVIVLGRLAGPDGPSAMLHEGFEYQGEYGFQKAVMAAIPCAPACQAASRSSMHIPPSA